MDDNTSTGFLSAVITPGLVHYGDGSTIRPRGDLTRSMPDIVRGTMQRFAQHCTIIVDGDTPLDGWEALRAEGWSYSKPDAWTLFYRRDGRTCSVGIRPLMQPRHLGVLFEADTDPGVLAMVLDRFQRVTGFAWRGTAATTALAGLRLTWAGEQYEPRWTVTPPPGIGPTGPLMWSRDLTARERSWGWVHRFDANGAYLGAMINGEVCWSTLEHSGEREFDPTQPGYWRVVVTPRIRAAVGLDNPMAPSLFEERQIIDGQAWLTTPIAGLSARLSGDPLVVTDSHTNPKSRGTGVVSRPRGVRVARGYGEVIRDARERAGKIPGSLGVTISGGVKHLYKDAIGGVQRVGMRVYRPDWAHTWIDLWRATLFMRTLYVHETQGVWPVAVKVDSLAYADSWPELAAPGTGEFETLTAAVRVASCTVPRCECAPHTTGPLGTYKHEWTITAQAYEQMTAPRERKPPTAPRTSRRRANAGEVRDAA